MPTLTSMVFATVFLNSFSAFIAFKCVRFDTVRFYLLCQIFLSLRISMVGTFLLFLLRVFITNLFKQAEVQHLPFSFNLRANLSRCVSFPCSRCLDAFCITALAHCAKSALRYLFPVLVMPPKVERPPVEC